MRSTVESPVERACKRPLGGEEKMRPMYLPKEKLRAKLDIYLSQGERKQIEAKAHEAGLGLSSFIRKAALGVTLKSIPAPNIALWRELSRVGGNLNQLCHSLNAGKASGVDIDTIKALAEQVRLLRLDLLGGTKS